MPRIAAAFSAIALAGTALTACSNDDSNNANNGNAGDPDELTLALVPSQDQNDLVNTAKPLTDYLTEELGITVNGVVSKDYQAAVEAIGADQAQIGFLPSLQMYQANDIEQVPVTANDASVLAVYNGDAEVGFSFWDAREIVDDQPDVGEKVTVFALTEEIPNDGVVVSAKLSEELQEKISEALQKLADTPEGQDTLELVYSITDLAPADPSTLDVVAEAANELGLDQ
ncbi:hypothetical protein AAV33_08100 [Corynebacterium otitidis]|nr:hypothetical protein AAV33_08100 [Corynebacterium otitidis]